MRGAPGPRPAWLTRNVLVLGLVSLLNDSASEMIAPLFPLFLTLTLGGAPVMLGLVEGAADATSSLLKLVSGRLADRPGGGKPLIFGGYALASLTRPLLALTTTPLQVLVLRVTDRVGKGLRTSPRDALLAASAPKGRLGTVFGFHRAMDHAGAVLGALFAAIALWAGVTNFRWIFAASAIPAAFVLGLLAFLGKPSASTSASASASTSPSASPSASPGAPPRALPTALPPPRLRWFLGAVALFGIGHASDAFLLLKAGTAGVATPMLPVLWMALHLVKSVTSASSGPVADRFGRRRVIAAGWLVSAAIYAGFAVAHGTLGYAALFVVYGLYHGLTEGAEKAVASELAAGATGTALGWYNLVTGLVVLPAGLLFGTVWERAGAPAAFVLGAACAVAALLPLSVSGRVTALPLAGR